MERFDFNRERHQQLGEFLVLKFLVLSVVLVAALSTEGQNTEISRKAKSPVFTLVPRTGMVLVQREIQFKVRGTFPGSLRWYVNDVPGGNTDVGSISPSGLYTAPASAPLGGRVTVKAAAPGSSSEATVTVIYETQTGSPLRRSRANPRYFENSGGVVFLTGSHTWNNVQDSGPTDPPTPLDYNAYVAFLKSKNHNYTRLWAQNLPKSGCENVPSYVQPFPWKRSGPGRASDGKAKFNLREFDSAYFERLRARVQQAQANGVFVGVMLIEGFGVIQCGRSDDGFPFYAANNINNIHAARGPANWKRTGSFRDIRNFPFYTRYFCRHEWVTGANPAVVEIQKAYVSKVVNTLNEFDNVVWEISNEAGANSTNWQLDLIQFIREAEANLPKKHPVGFTFQYGTTCGGQTETLFQSDADWISPGTDVGDYRGLDNGPAPNDGEKVILSDTDHLWGVGGNPLWVWKSFLRGLNVLYMDSPFGDHSMQLKTDDGVRQAMGDVLSFARSLPLAKLVPSTTTCSTGFSMIDQGKEYLCLAPSGGRFRMDLSVEGAAKFSLEWFDISTRQRSLGGAYVGSGTQSFVCPSGDKPCILHLKRTEKR
jgi:hypothetical protein